MRSTLARLAAVAIIACFGIDAAIGGEPVVTVPQRWSQAIAPRTQDCDGRINIADPLVVSQLAVTTDRFGNHYIGTGPNGPGIVSLTPAGRVRWVFATCPEWPDANLSQYWYVLAADERGGAWVLETRSHTVIDMYWRRFHHVDANGHVSASINGFGHGVPLDAAIAVRAPNLQLVWTGPLGDTTPDSRRTVEFDTTGNIVAERTVVRGDDRVVMGNILSSPHGERMIGIATVPRSSPSNLGHDIVLASIGTDDVVRHITTLSMPFVQTLRGDDNALWITQYQQPRTLTRLSLAGDVSTVDINPPLPAAYDAAWFASRVGGRFLFGGDGRLALVNENGDVARDVALPAQHALVPMTGAQPGVLLRGVGDDGVVATLLAADDLSPRVRFAITLPALEVMTDENPRSWHANADGSIATIDQRRDPDGIVRTRAVGFAMPGSVAEARVQRDGFEP